MIRRPASLHAVPRCDGVPALHGRLPPPSGTIRALRLPAARPASLRLPSLGGAVGAFLLRSRGPTNARTAGLDCCGSASPCRVMFRRRRQDLPSSWGTPIAPSPGSSTPAGPAASDPCDAVARPPLRKRQGLLHCRFRGSIPRLWCSLSTLRPGGLPPRTQDSLPAAGQALPGGLDPQGSIERFQSVLHLILLSQACLAQSRTRGRRRWCCR
jgi:hypothetical protein